MKFSDWLRIEKSVFGSIYMGRVTKRENRVGNILGGIIKLHKKDANRCIRRGKISVELKRDRRGIGLK